MLSAINWSRGSLASSTICVLCQVFQPAAFLVHPLLAAFAEDAVSSYSSAADSTWGPCLSSGKDPDQYAIHDLRIPCIHSQTLFLHTFILYF